MTTRFNSGFKLVYMFYVIHIDGKTSFLILPKTLEVLFYIIYYINYRFNY